MRAILAFLFIFGRVLSQYCRSPLGQPSACIPSYQCAYFQALLKKPISRSTVSFIQRSVCGGDHRGVLVCCPRFYQNGLEMQGFQSTARYHSVRSTPGLGRATPPPTTTSSRPGTVTSPERTLVDEDWKPSPVGRCGKQEAVDRIYGGQVAELDEFPWLALMFYSKSGTSEVKHRCGGVLLNRRFVLTAAHCVRGNKKLEFVRLGEYDTKKTLDCIEKDRKKICADPPQDILVQEIIAQPGYNHSMTTSLHDIAIVKLARRVHYNSYVQPICLPEAGAKLSGGDVVTIAGWGDSYPVRGVPVKQKVQLPIFEHAACTEKYLNSIHSFRITREQICAGGEFSKDACSGDSGMPLMSQAPSGHWEASGVMSFGRGCGMDGIPGVYTDVQSYVDWILERMKTLYSQRPII